jgi:hypothetical protein
VPSVEQILAHMRTTPPGVRFADLMKVCDHYFGPFGTPRQAGSHHIYKTPWPGDPRVNIQIDGAEAKAYQVRQVIEAVDRLRQTEE